MAEGLGRVRSCSECRIQKLRCDARENYQRPCTRCRKNNLTCELSRGIKKSQRKTQVLLPGGGATLTWSNRKAELVRENASLYEQLNNHNNSNNNDVSSQTVLPATTWASASPQSAKPAPTPSVTQLQQQSIAQTTGHDGQISDISSHAGTSGVPGSVPPVDILPDVPVGSHGFQVAPTTLEIGQIGRDKIHDCFALFFTHYEIFLTGLLDPNMPPEEYYERSPFLFWSIVATGARRYANDPTLFQRVVSQVQQIALGTLFSSSNPIPTIQAVLILCLWPIPVNSMCQDTSHTFGAVAMQLAVQNGLHVLGHQQDYERQNINTSNSEVSWRFRLWIHCVLTVQNSNLVDGFPCWTVAEIGHTESDEMLEHILSPSLFYQYKLYKVQTDAIQAITQSVELLKPNCGPPLNSLIDVFDAQVRALVPVNNREIDVLVQKCTRLGLRAFHFFATPDAARTAGLVQLYALCCSVLDMLHDLDAANDFALYSTQWLHRMLILAAHIIIRITFSKVRTYVDLEHGERAFFKAIKFTRKRSVENNDLDSRAALILTQLWANNSSFRKKDGALIGDRMRLRSRLFSSIMSDSNWHWRATFGHRKPNPYKADDDEEEQEGEEAFAADEQHQASADWTSSSTSMLVPPSQQPQGSATPPPLTRNPSTFLGGQMLNFDAFADFQDWDWAPLRDGMDLSTISHFAEADAD